MIIKLFWSLTLGEWIQQLQTLFGHLNKRIIRETMIHVSTDNKCYLIEFSYSKAYNWANKYSLFWLHFTSFFFKVRKAYMYTYLLVRLTEYPNVLVFRSRSNTRECNFDVYFVLFNNPHFIIWGHLSNISHYRMNGNTTDMVIIYEI